MASRTNFDCLGQLAQVSAWFIQPQASDNDWVQAYGRQDKDCLEWNDTCVNCVRAQSGGDYSCANIGIACQPKEVDA
jgi:hypothetical protein